MMFILSSIFFFSQSFWAFVDFSFFEQEGSETPFFELSNATFIHYPQYSQNDLIEPINQIEEIEMENEKISIGNEEKKGLIEKEEIDEKKENKKVFVD